MIKQWQSVLVSFSLAAAACSGAPSEDSDATSNDQEALRRRNEPGAVFTMSNAAEGNAVLAFRSGRSGELEPAGQVPSGGLGSGAGLASQGSVALDETGRFLLVVNPGSDDVTSFLVHGTDLTPVARVPSGGQHPISVAVRHRLVYVLNDQGTANISGFWLGPDGALWPIPGSARSLSAPAPNPAQVGIAPWGLGVVVTEKGTNQVDTFSLKRDGTLSDVSPHPSSGAVPFGFNFSPWGTLVVSEAQDSAASSYSLRPPDQLTTISASVPDHAVAACWVAITPDGRYAYVANAGSNFVSGYRIAPHGELELLNADGVTGSTGEGSTPLDLAVDARRHLYVVDAGNHAIVQFQVGDDGELTPIGTATGLPAHVVGIAAK